MSHRVSLNEVKTALGIGHEDTTFDYAIQNVIDDWEELVCNEFFSEREVAAFSKEQQKKFRLGMSLYIAGQVAYSDQFKNLLLSADSVTIGPIRVSGMSGGSVREASRMAKELQQRGRDILQNLSIESEAFLRWGAV